MLSGIVHAQGRLRFYSSALPEYPKFHHLFSGLIANNTGTTANINLKFSLSGSYISPQTDSINFTAQPGINNLLSDSFLSRLYLKNNIDTSYLEPGAYSFSISISGSGSEINDTRTFRVPPFRLITGNQGKDTIILSMQPPLPDAQFYVCRAQRSRISKKPVKVNCYTASAVIARQAFTPDTLTPYRYSVAVFYKEKNVASTGYFAWEQAASASASNTPVTAGTRNLDKYINAGADIGVEYGYTNVRYSNQLSATQYTRLYLSPTLAVMGVPLTFNTMLTTEHNSTYPVNNFQLSFDAAKFASGFSGNMLSEKLNIEQNLEMNKLELDDVNRSLSGLKKPEFQYVPDSLNLRHNDSISNPARFSMKQKRRAQSAKKIDDEYEQLRLKKESLEYQRYKDSVYLASRYAPDLPGDTLKRYYKKRKGLNLAKGMLAIRSLNVGMCTPHYSSITLSQVPLQGAHIDLRFPHWLLSATAGRRITFQHSMGIRELIRPRFENKTYAARIGYIERRSRSTLAFSWFSFENNPTLLNSKTAENNILSVDFESNFIDFITLKTELAKSFYSPDATNELVTEKYSIERSWNKDFDNLSFVSSLDIRATPNTEFTLSGKRIGTGYYTLGIPFLRNDYIEYSAAWKQLYWKKQLETELSFMQNRDNLVGNKTHTTILSGYGASLKTHFRTKPNLLLIYKPFNSSFSFENNLFNPPAYQPVIVTQQFYVFHATLFYNTSITGNNAVGLSSWEGNKKATFSLSYNRSNNSNSAGSTYTLETLTGNASLTDKTGQRLSYNASLYRSSIALNNSMLHDISFTTPLFKSAAMFTGGAIAQFVNDNRKRAGMYIKTGYNFKNISISARLASNYIEGNWFIGHSNIEHNVSILLEWKL